MTEQTPKNFWGTKVGIIFIVVLALYGFYAIYNDLTSGQMTKILTVVIGFPIVWYMSGKSIKRAEMEKEGPEEKEKSQAEGEVKVSIENGFWTCPNCKTKMLEAYDVCKDCGQMVTGE